ncbi:hypothetical protein B0B36_05330 [Pseudomonas syringae pv. actinidifoliorum]|nr:hypothetical protein [Pseudomonas syringae pv. actinidifoliorum]OOK99658.1 hypothetical protein B0B36_05330 [Pseudomonas syringae pv. actinidifoliorum]
MGCEAAQNRPPWLYLVHRVSLFHTSEASPGPYIYRASARRAWERTCSRWLRSGPKPATLVASGAPRRLVLVPVPGSSRTSEASPGPR